MALNKPHLSLLSFSTLYLLQILITTAVASKYNVATPPLPVLPLPSFSQLKWQQREIIMFFHFGVNTFTGSEKGTGYESPSVFNPTALDTNQWLDAAASAGVSLVLLTAKHHDGFCLWPSEYTDHSVAASPWKGGCGDVVGELVGAATKRGVDVGFYLSPWDKHDGRYGKEVEYNEYYLAQLQELLTKYGKVKEIWFDGYHGPKGSNTTNMTYHFSDWFAMVKELQGTINIFSDAGLDVRWVGNEDGFAGETCWSTINRTALSIGNWSIVDYLNTGDPHGTDWLPAECDVSIRPSWFWHESESPKRLSHLLDIYYNCVGRNSLLLLNVPPNTTGLISETDVDRLREFRASIDTIFSTNLAQGCSARASSQRGGDKKNGGAFRADNVLDDDHLWTYWAPSERERNGEYWIEIKCGDGLLKKFNVIRVQEAIGLGQRVKRHEVYVDGVRVAKGTTIGYKRLHRIGNGVDVTGESVRVKVLDSRDVPLISSIGIHYDPYWHP
ncbi:Alpha-L-fucosidase 1 [Linum grandiflorum]